LIELSWGGNTALTDNTGTPGSESLAGTDADDSIAVFGGDDVIHGGGDLDIVDHDGPVTTSKLTALAEADSSTPGDQPGRTESAMPTESSNAQRSSRTAKQSLELQYTGLRTGEASQLSLPRMMNDLAGSVVGEHPNRRY
jgi:hypothetical protein